MGHSTNDHLHQNKGIQCDGNVGGSRKYFRETRTRLQSPQQIPSKQQNENQCLWYIHIYTYFRVTVSHCFCYPHMIPHAIYKKYVYYTDSDLYTVSLEYSNDMWFIVKVMICDDSPKSTPNGLWESQHPPSAAPTIPELGKNCHPKYFRIIRNTNYG